MKTLFLIAILGPAIAVGTAGCSKSDDSAASAQLQDARVDTKEAPADGWDSVRECTFDDRMQFSNSINRMTAIMDGMIAKEKAAPPDTLSSDRQAAIVDYDLARADLKASLADLGNATAETWTQAKATVGDAWERLKTDYYRAKG